MTDSPVWPLIVLGALVALASYPRSWPGGAPSRRRAESLSWVAVALDAQWLPAEARPDPQTVVKAHGVWPGASKAAAIADAREHHRNRGRAKGR